MANDDKNTQNHAISAPAGKFATVTRVMPNRPKVEPTFKVSSPARKVIAHLDDMGNIKVPKKRRTSDSWRQDFPWFEELAQPQILYYFCPDKDTQIAVEPVLNEAGEADFELFQDSEGNQYTYENVVQVPDLAAKEVTTTPDGYAKLTAAISAFNKATGKKLITRYVSSLRDKAQRTLEQTTEVIRTQ